jgi:glycosyltransferase involved in cell wall biosynthesis
LISIICCTMRPSSMDNVFDNYVRQAIEKKEMIIVLNRDDMDIIKWRRRAKQYKNVTVYQMPEKYQLGKCLNVGIKKAKYNILAKFDDDDYYAPHYLKESLHALKRKKANIVGKHTSFLYFEGPKALMVFRRGGEKQYCRTVKGGTLVFRRSLWDKVKFNEKLTSGSDVKFLRDCRNRGYRVYSVSKYNYVCIRRDNIRSHTQKTDIKKYMARCKLIRHTNNYVPYIQRR